MWCRNYGVCLLSLLILIIFCVILTFVYSLRACHMWLTRNHMFIREIWGKFTSFIFWDFEISFVSFGRFYNFKKVNSVDLSQISLFIMWLLVLITRLIVTNIAPLTGLFYNYPLFYNCPLADFLLSTVKRY